MWAYIQVLVAHQIYNTVTYNTGAESQNSAPIVHSPTIPPGSFFSAEKIYRTLVVTERDFTKDFYLTF